MSINPEIVGRVYPAEGTYAVGREKIREFARAVHAKHPFHYDVESARAAGYADVIAPPTFAIILAQAADAAPASRPCWSVPRRRTNGAF